LRSGLFPALRSPGAAAECFFLAAAGNLGRRLFLTSKKAVWIKPNIPVFQVFHPYEGIGLISPLDARRQGGSGSPPDCHLPPSQFIMLNRIASPKGFSIALWKPLAEKNTWFS